MAQEGAIVRNKRTGQMGRIVNGQVVPIDGPAMSQPSPMGDPIVKPAPVDKPKPYEPPSGYTGTPDGLTPIPGGPADKPDPSVQDPKLTEYQAKSAAFLGRLIQSDQLFSQVPEDSRDARTAVGQWFHDSMPSIENSFNSPDRQNADQAARNFIAASLRQESGAAISASEYENQYRIFFPMPGDGPDVIKQKAAARKQAIEGFRVSAGPMADRVAATAMGGTEATPAADTPPGDTPQGGTGYGSANPTPPPFSPGDPQMQAANGTRTVEDPAMARVAGQYRQMLGEDRPASEIIGFLRSAGASPQTLMAAMAQIKYRRANPQVPLDKYSITATKDIPLSAYEQGITDVGSGAAGAYALGAGNFLSGNNLDSISGDPEKARLALQVSQAQNPNAFAVGEVTGGVLAGLTGEAGLARLGMANSLARGAIADAGMGGFNGAGMADGGNRAQNALIGAATGAAGSVGGTLATRGIARAIAPSGGNLGKLYEAGVRPTPGQRFADSGFAGRTLNATEEHLQSVPVIGSAIRGARQEARDQFQVGAFNEALREVGEQLPKGMKPGTDPHRFAQQVFDRVYADARSGMTVVADEELSNNLGDIFQQVGMLAKPSQSRFKAITENVVMRRLQNGHLTGDGYKKAYSDLGRQIRGIRNNPSGDGELADALQELQGALDGAARRHSDPAAVELLDAADAGYAKLVRIEEAAKSRGGEAGTFSPNQFDRAVQKTSGGTRSKAYLRGDALMEDYASQGRTLEDRVPNSGTPERQLAAAALAGGVGYVSPPAAIAGAAVGAAYAPGIRKATAGALAPSGPKARAIAARLKKRARLIGAATASTGVAALEGTGPSQ